jgi:hypothetical protein
MTLPPFDELIKIFYHPMIRKARTNKKGPRRGLDWIVSSTQRRITVIRELEY